MKQLKKFIINGLILTFTTLIIHSISIFFNAFISRKIGTEAVGLYGLITSIYSFSITISLFGLSLASTKIITEEITIYNFGDIQKIMRKCLCFSLFFSGFSSILLVFFAPYISNIWLHNKVSTIPFYLIAISLPFISMASCLTGYFSAIRNTTIPASQHILEHLLKMILISFFLNKFLPAGLEYTCLSLILGNITSEILSFLYIYTLYCFDKRKYTKYTPTKQFYIKRILKISLPIGLTSCIRSGLSTLKQILIPIKFEKYGYNCEKALQNYGLINGMAMQILMFPSIIVSAYSSLLIPEFTEFKTNSDYKLMKKICNKALKYTSYFSLIVAVLLFINSNKLSYIIYKNTNVAFYIKILCPLIPLMYVDNIIDSILKGLDKQVAVLKINILDLCSTIFLILLIIPYFGVHGYIFAIYCSEILNFTLSFRTLWKTLYRNQ